MSTTIRRRFAALISLFAGGIWSAAAQRPARAPTAPGIHGVWEPVNYTEDINLTSAFFVTPDVGWVAGAAGTILHTTDGGTTWAAQLGGDPGSQENPVQWLQFIDGTHGWAIQSYATLLRTTDGETWQQIGSDVRGGVVFVSRTRGFRAYGSIYETRDAGRTWKEIFPCRARLVVDGLTRDVKCDLGAVYFASPRVGYAVGQNAPHITAKTEDGGATWKLLVAPAEPGDQRAWDVVFVDPSVGFHVRSGSRLYRTADGGATWTGVVAAPGPHVRFADPEVGWSIASKYGGAVLSYTTDGGRHWSSRTFEFPAAVSDFSLPRRDRAYVVGEHGMIYRYRVLPAGEPAVAKAIDAPPMPVPDSPLDDQVADASEQLSALGDTLKAAADAADSSAEATLVDDCCATSVNRLQATVEALTPLVPSFLRRYRNVNLVIAGLQLAGLLPDRLASVRTALADLRHAKGPEAATAALAELETAMQGLRQSTAQAFDATPPMATATDVPPDAGEPSAETADADSTAAADSEATADQPKQAQKAAVQKAKHGLGNAIKKKIKLP